ncbi:MAG: hypothetical protein AAF125_06525, partial [Chloroflexota bacterium]
MTDFPIEPKPGSRVVALKKIDRAIVELQKKRDVLSEETHKQVLLALYERRRTLLTARTPAESLNEQQQDDEIRLVTVMFIDVVDSTQIAETVDLETWRMLIGEAHQQ